MTHVASNPMSMSMKLEMDKNTVSITDTYFDEIIRKCGDNDPDLVRKELEKSGYLIRYSPKTPKFRIRFNGMKPTGAYKLKLPEDTENNCNDKTVSLEDMLKNFEGMDDI